MAAISHFFPRSWTALLRSFRKLIARLARFIFCATKSKEYLKVYNRGARASLRRGLLKIHIDRVH